MMKKILAMLLCLGLTMMFVGCSVLEDLMGDQNENEQQQDTQQDTQQETDANETVDTETAVVYGDYVTLGNYKGLPLTLVEPVAVTDQDVENAISELFADLITLVEVDRAARDGDVVNIDFNCYIDGELLEDGSETDYDVEIGSDAFIDNFEQKILGVVKGQNLKVNITFPETASEDLAGKSAELDVTVNSVSEYHYPEINDELVASSSEYKTVAEMRDGVRAQLVEANANEAEYENMSAAWTAVLESSTVTSYPESLVAAYENEYIAYYQDYYNMYSTDPETGETVDFETFLQEYYGADSATFYADAKEYASSILDEELIYKAIAEKENITMTDAEYAEGAQKYATMYGYETTEEFEEYYGYKAIYETLFMEKVIFFILDNAVAA